MGIVAGTLTPEEIQQALQQAQQLSTSTSESIRLGQFVFFAAFDGTNNDRDHLELSGDPQVTNAAQLEYQVAEANLGNQDVVARYYKGPGTDGTLPGSSALPWQVTRQVIDTAVRAYNDFADQASKWLDGNPGGSVTAAITGFSRGAASAAVFSQLLYEKGLVDPRTGDVLIAPGQVGVSGGIIFDPVLTGVYGNMDFAPNAHNITVVRAMDEFRALFPAAEFNDPKITTIDFYGNHCDVGGCYEGGLGSLALHSATGFFRNLGLNIADVPQERLFDPAQPVVFHTEGVDAYGHRIWDEYGSRGSRSTASAGMPSTIQFSSDGSVVETITLFDGSVLQRTTDADGSVIDYVIHTGGETLLDGIAQSGGTLIDALSLVKAIQSGSPLPIAASGLRLANAIDRFDGVTDYSVLAGASNIASGVLSILSLENALQQGDALAAVTAGAQALQFGASAYVSFASQELMEFVPADVLQASALSQSLGQALPYLNIVNSLAHGDAVGAAASVADLVLINAGLEAIPYIGWAYAAYTLISSLFDDDTPPQAWGSAHASWSGLAVEAAAVGENGGQEAARASLEQFISVLNRLAAQEQALNPGSAVGLIANRLPALSYRDREGYGLTDIDALSGMQRNPEIRYDSTYRPYNAPAGSEQASQSLAERFLRVALARGAIAPLWEVRTAARQSQAGDPQAGLSEEERAGRAGELAAPASGASQRWRPLQLDLNGDGLHPSAGRVAFDVDDSGYYKNTEWVSAEDGLLVLDRNLNGSVDSARELFSNAAVALSARGLAGLRWVDADDDGRLTAADPVWSELKVWRDANGNAQLEAGEQQSLAALGITSLNYTMGSFEQNGVTKQMASPDLQADTEGLRTHAVPEGIVVETSGGKLSLLVTRIDDRTAIEANRDGVTSYEDTEAIIATGDLLANDSLGGFVGRNLSVAAVSDFTHGTGYLDANGLIHYLPEVNYYGPASFSYQIKAQTGQSASAAVDITIQNVNDPPSIIAVNDDTRAIYGYAPYRSDEGGSYGGEAIYTPYYEAQDEAAIYHGTPIAYEDAGTGAIVAADIDDATSALTYEIAAAPQYGEASIGADGRYQYTGWQSPNTPSGPHKEGDEERTDSFQVKVTDPHGASVTQTVSVTHYGPYTPSLPGGGGGKKPIAIDLDGNGFHFTDVDDSNVFFDVNGDGWRHRTSWVAPGDGLLAYDADGNGRIDQGTEIGFIAYRRQAQSDLEALKAFDSNGDGLFSAADDKWAKFGIWQDADQDGVTDAGEFRTLDQMGVQSVSLTTDGQFAVVDGQTVHGVGTVTMRDGRVLSLADTTLSYSNDVLVSAPDGSSRIVTRRPFSDSGEEIAGTDGNDLLLGKTGNNLIQAGAGDDVVFEDSGNDAIDAGDGDDVVYSGADNDLVIAGVGNDVVFAGLGNDVVLGGDGQDALLGEGGHDVLFGGAGNDLLSGGAGNDVLAGDQGDDQVYGGAGDDALFGGAGEDVLTGNEGNDLLDGAAGNDLLEGGAGADTMMGGAGDDVYVVDDPGDTVLEAPGEGTDTVRAAIDYALGDEVENLTLTGSADLTATGNALDNTLRGNAGNNTLYGADGNDVLDGGAGADTMEGGAGDDTYLVDDPGDMIIEYADSIGYGGAYGTPGGYDGDGLFHPDYGGGYGGDWGLVPTGYSGGIDTVKSSVDYVLPAHVENLILTGRADLSGSGNALDNVLTGNRADNWIDGGAGADTMAGGEGDDTYVVDHPGDIVIENPGAGTDTVRAAFDYTLGDNLENLVLSGSNDVAGMGNALDNVISGNDGANRLDGALGADTMLGGAGDDSYVIDDAGDAVIENADEGIDTVLSGISYVLPADVEHLLLSGAADLAGSGNDLANHLTGNSGANRLDGGAGADVLAGGAGDDTYLVDNASDVVAEQPGEGTDTVLAAVSYALPTNVEDLTLTGAANLVGTGNALDNVLSGNAGAHTLIGGAGNDTLIAGGGLATLLGGSGDDLYVVNHADDVVVENSAEGLDTVLSSVTYTLSPNVERLTLTGAADLDATGNGLDNLLSGNSGDNMLTGGGGNDTFSGGAGNDTLVGGSGDDTYFYAQGDGLDRIADAGGSNTVQLGSGLGLDNVVIRLTDADGQPYVVPADARRGRGGEWNGEDWDEEHGRRGQRTLTAQLRLLDAHGVEQADQGLDFAVTVDRRGTLGSPIQRFELAEGSTLSFEDLLIRQEIIDAHARRGAIVTGRNDAIVHAGQGTSSVSLGSGNGIVYASPAGTTVSGGGGNDYMVGTRGNDVFDGGWGIDVLDGGAGDDSLRDAYGAGALLGGDGQDTLAAGAGNAFLAGGRGNDTLAPGAARSVIAFNAGDGCDTILAAPGAAHTLSLGEDIDEDELRFAKRDNDLVLGSGRHDTLTFQDWYASPANHNFVTLQLIEQARGEHRHAHDPLPRHKVEQFDFQALVAAFDAARAQQALTSWQLMDGLLSAHLAGSDSAALGGDLAWQYGVSGGLGGMGLAAAQHTLKDPQFGSEAQTLHARAELDGGPVRLR